ncbi:MAG: LssY C-terminal domain-containing protein [Elusimicrobiota bacterium]
MAAAFLALSLDRVSPESSRPPIMTLPAVNEGRFGHPGTPLNLIFEGSAENVRAALLRAGWIEVPTAVRSALFTGAWPMNDYRLGGRRQDMNWEISVRPFAERHHFRLWRTGIKDLWWGTGNYDRSIRWSDLSHVPDPDMDRERDFIVGTLAGSAASLLRLPQIPLEGVDDKGYPYRTDGRAAVIALKP